ncbi:MAG: DUF421 domain-containing protein [Mycobacterium leprae]
MAEWLVRNGVVFVLLLLLSRFVARPRLGKRGLIDVVMVNAIGDLAAHTVFETQHPMLPGLASVGIWMLVLAGIAVVTSRWPSLERYYLRPPVRVVQDGRSDAQALLSVGISRSQLESELRSYGLESLDQVKEATAEPDGSISVIEEFDAATELRRLSNALAALAAQIETQRR